MTADPPSKERRRAARILAPVVALALVVGGCADAVPPSDGPPSAEPSFAIQAGDLRYTCGLYPFAPEILTAGPGTDERADNPAAAALRTHLGLDMPDANLLPDTGWRLTGMDGRSAEFVAVRADRTAMYATVSNAGEGWKVGGWGDCQPRIVLPAGLGSAEWAFDPAQPNPDAATQVFDALVTEMTCNDGLPADGRFLGPQIIKSADTVLVIFAVRSLPGTHSCPSNPSTRIRVDLGEPLGARKLLDGGRLPPGDPTQSRF